MQATLEIDNLDADTLRSYGQTLRRLLRELGETIPLGQVTAQQTAAVFTVAWNEAAPRTWNRHRSALRLFTTWAVSRSQVTTDLAAHIERRPEQRDRTRAIDQHKVQALLADRDVPLREKTLWRLAYESAARADEILALNIEDLDLDNKRGRVTGKGDTIRWIHWQSGTARLLPRLMGGRTSGPLSWPTGVPDPPEHPRPPTCAHRPAAAAYPTNAPNTCSSSAPRSTIGASAASPSTSFATPGSPTWPRTAGPHPC